MRATQAAYGRIDVLVNNVGGTIWMKPYHLYTEGEVKFELEKHGITLGRRHSPCSC